MTIRRAFGFETDLTFIGGETGVVTAGTVTIDTGTKHQTTSGYGGAKSMKLAGGSASFRCSGAGGVADEIHFALNGDATGQRSLQLNDSGAANQCGITWDTDGFVRIRRGSATAGTLLATSAGTFTFNVWNTWKIIVTAREAASSGRIQVFINGSSSAFVDTGAGVDCRATSTDDFATISFGQSGGNAFIDDLVWASTGTIPDEPLYIVKLTPTSDDTANWTHSTGASNFGTVDEDPVSTVDFNSTTVAATKDYLGLSDLSASPATILGVKPTCYCTGDGTLTNMRTGVKSSGVEALGTNQAVSNGTFSTVFDFFTVDPNTSAAWTAAAVNAMAAGYQANT